MPPVSFRQKKCGGEEPAAPPARRKLVCAGGSSKADLIGLFHLEICSNMPFSLLLCGKSRSMAEDLLKRSEFFSSDRAESMYLL